MQNLLRRALAREELSLQYQPKVSIATGEIVGMEALIRWSSRELGSILPEKFIPLAEEAGLVVPIGEWMLRAACAQNKAWQRKGLPRLTMSVNLSPRQFRQSNLSEVIASALCDTALDPALLELEITENTVMHHADKAAAMLADIHNLGYRSPWTTSARVTRASRT
jgi:EAL domain-containing protein (putative c-di-GMP-specific phosphodiesterase class I)